MENHTGSSFTLNEVVQTITSLVCFMTDDPKAEVTLEGTSSTRLLIVKTTEKGRIIGKRGKNIKALQTIIAAISPGLEGRPKIVVEIDDNT